MPKQPKQEKKPYSKGWLYRARFRARKMVLIGIMGFVAPLLGQSFEAGKAAFAAKDFPESIKQFELAAEKNPSQDVIWANLGRAYNANKQYDAAIEAYQKAIALKANESNYFLNLSVAQLGAGKVEDSTDSIGKAAALNPANGGQGYYNLGAYLVDRDRHSDAVDPLKRAIKLDPRQGPAYFQLGLTLVQLGKLGEALGYLQKCLDLGAGCPDAAKAKALVIKLNAR